MKRIPNKVLLLLLALCLTPPARPVAAAPPEVPPGVPRWVAARPLESGRAIGLRWSVVPGATAFELFRREGGGDPRPLATAQGLQHLDETVQPGRSYGYSLRALSGGGLTGPFSEERTVQIPLPAAVDELHAPRWRRQRVEMSGRAGRPPSFRVQLGWRPVRGAVGYRLWRSDGDGSGFEPLGTFTELDIVDNAVESGRAYAYVLTAIDALLRESPRSLELPVQVDPEFAALAPDDDAAGYPARLVWEVGNAPAGGGAAPDKAPLTDPVDIAFDRRRDRVYISSAQHRHVVVLDGATGVPAGVIGPRLGKHELRVPLGLGVDGGGNLIVVDQGQEALFVVAPDGRLVRRIAVRRAKGGKPPRLIDAAAHPRDGRIFATDAANGKVLVFSREGRQIAAWGKAGARAGEFGAIGAIEVAANGNVAVADAAAGRIKVFSAAGNYLKATGARGPDAGGFVFLGGFAGLRDGRILAADVGASAVKLSHPDGASELPVAAGSNRYQLLGPVAVAGDGADRFFVADGIANRVTCFRLDPAEKLP